MAKTPEFDPRKPRENYIINGDMRISQRGTSFPAIANGTYSLDRFTYTKVGAMVHTVSQDTDVPTFTQSGYTFQNSLLATLTTPDTSIAAGDLLKFEQHVEGYNYARLHNKPFTLSFWVKATLPGGGPQTYCVAFGNADSTRVYVVEYTISLSDTWEYKTITVPPPPSGTWNLTNGSGLRLHWSIAVGSTFHGAANTWNTSATFSTANQVNGTNTGYTSFRLTGVMLNEGYDALPFKLFGGDFEAEFSACRRYFTKYSGAVGLAQNTTTVHQVVSLQPEMRTTPTPGFTGALQITDQIAADFTQSSGNSTNVSLNSTGGRVSCANFTGLVAQRFYTNEPDAGTFMTFDAEL